MASAFSVMPALPHASWAPARLLCMEASSAVNMASSRVRALRTALSSVFALSSSASSFVFSVSSLAFSVSALAFSASALASAACNFASSAAFSASSLAFSAAAWASPAPAEGSSTFFSSFFSSPWPVNSLTCSQPKNDSAKTIAKSMERLRHLMIFLLLIHIDPAGRSALRLVPIVVQGMGESTESWQPSQLPAPPTRT